MKHTKGPWYIENGVNVNGLTKYYISNYMNDGSFHVPIAEVGGNGGFSKDEVIANARLISTAPEMLEVLKYISKFNIGIESIENRISKVIQKVEGE